MNTQLKPACRPALIGSLPISDHGRAVELVRENTPEIPLWIQLPQYPGERMIPQFCHGLPGYGETEGKSVLNEQAPDFEEQQAAFWEEYLAGEETGEISDHSRFALQPDYAPGFFAYTKALESWSPDLYAIKGQVTGPFTLATSLKDSRDRAVFYDDNLLECVVKSIAAKASWQAKKLAAFGKPVVLFLDEPALAGFGSSAFISISKEAVANVLGEVISAVKAQGAFVGVHICANADWSLILESEADVASFDAFSFFDQFVAYQEPLGIFLDAGKNVAWGLVPTGDPKDVNAQTPDTLLEIWNSRMRQVADLGISLDKVFEQSLITPACGCGSLSEPDALRVLSLTKELSQKIRNQ